MIRLFSLTIILLSFLFFSFLPIQPNYNLPPQNVIFYIGDGMGISQITAYRIKMKGANGRTALDRFSITGLVTTHSTNDLITDSGASSTAMATGHKTRNKMISVLPDSTKVLSILEAARDKGLATGIIATSSITHATPACFGAHVLSRYHHTKIAEQLIDANFYLLYGGGKQYFIPRSKYGSKRDDDTDLIQKAEEAGYKFIETKEQLKKFPGGKQVGLFQLGALKTIPSEPSLKELTSKAIEILKKNKKGFFLVVEGSQIDWACHDQDFDGLIRQMKSFDDAVEVGFNYAEQNRNTLVIVTADHETGGLDIVGGGVDGSNLKIKWNTDHHTGQMIPIFAEGPEAYRFSGILDNTEIPVILARILKFNSFSEKFTNIKSE